MNGKLCLDPENSKHRIQECNRLKQKPRQKDFSGVQFSVGRQKNLLMQCYR